MDMFEMAFFYGDYSSLPTSDDLIENVVGTTTPDEILDQTTKNLHLHQEFPSVIIIVRKGNLLKRSDPKLQQLQSL